MNILKDRYVRVRLKVKGATDSAIYVSVVRLRDDALL